LQPLERFVTAFLAFCVTTGLVLFPHLEVSLNRLLVVLNVAPTRFFETDGGFGSELIVNALRSNHVRHAATVPFARGGGVISVAVTAGVAVVILGVRDGRIQQRDSNHYSNRVSHDYGLSFADSIVSLIFLIAC
jgi:hypothetical protein